MKRGTPVFFASRPGVAAAFTLCAIWQSVKADSGSRPLSRAISVSARLGAVHPWDAWENPSHGFIVSRDGFQTSWAVSPGEIAPICATSWQKNAFPGIFSGRCRMLALHYQHVLIFAQLQASPRAAANIAFSVLKTSLPPRKTEKAAMPPGFMRLRPCPGQPAMRMRKEKQGFSFLFSRLAVSFHCGRLHSGSAL